MKPSHILFLLTFSFLLSACNPHPGTGVWSSTEDNEYGISKLVVGYDGRVDFSTKKPDNTSWRCFWGAKGKQEIDMNCKSSKNPDQEENYILTVNDQGLAELRHNSRLVALFTRQAETRQ